MQKKLNRYANVALILSICGAVLVIVSLHAKSLLVGGIGAGCLVLAQDYADRYTILKK